MDAFRRGTPHSLYLFISILFVGLLLPFFPDFVAGQQSGHRERVAASLYEHCYTSNDCRKCGAECRADRGKTCRGGKTCLSPASKCMGYGSSGKCVECRGSYDCSGSRSKCRSNRCVECTRDSDCGSGCGSRCEGNNCVSSGIQCTSSAPICIPSRSACVECRYDSDCRGGRRNACDTTTNKCVECVRDSHCRSDKDCKATCSNKTCQRSNAILNCNILKGTPHCDTVSGVCQACTKNSHCLNKTAPFCAGNFQCEQCSSNRDCRSDTNCNAKCREDTYACFNASETPLDCAKGLFCSVALGECLAHKTSSSAIKMLQFSRFFIGPISLAMAFAPWS